MQCHPRRHSPTTQAMMDHLRIQRPNHRSCEIELADKEGPGGNVDDAPGKCFVEGCVGVTEALETCAGAEGLLECGAEGEEGVFGSMMVVDLGKVKVNPHCT